MRDRSTLLRWCIWFCTGLSASHHGRLGQWFGHHHPALIELAVPACAAYACAAIAAFSSAGGFTAVLKSRFRIYAETPSLSVEITLKILQQKAKHTKLHTVNFNTHETTKKKKKKKRLSDVSVPHAQSWPRWAHSVSNTRVTVEHGIKFGIDQNRDAAANCWRLAPVTHAGRAASSPEIFRPFLTVCLTVFPFEFRPRTFTIGFYGKKSFISELMILECSFPLSLKEEAAENTVNS